MEAPYGGESIKGNIKKGFSFYLFVFNSVSINIVPILSIAGIKFVLKSSYDNLLLPLAARRAS